MDEFKKKLDEISLARCKCSFEFALKYCGPAIPVIIMEAKGVISKEEADYLQSFD